MHASLEMLKYLAGHNQFGFAYFCWLFVGCFLNGTIQSSIIFSYRWGRPQTRVCSSPAGLSLRYHRSQLERTKIRFLTVRKLLGPFVNHPTRLRRRRRRWRRRRRQPRVFGIQFHHRLRGRFCSGQKLVEVVDFEFRFRGRPRFDHFRFRGRVFRGLGSFRKWPEQKKITLEHFFFDTLALSLNLRELGPL